MQNGVSLCVSSIRDYECFKSVEKNKPDIEQLRFGCQYWILVAVLIVSERIGDTSVSW
ncbi:hypothetical protein HanOQP8_Chr01g0000711 [Helianthus annuus]|nr:hypothetical protein HanOQP8_Chr01g0000711 [Helianthus annuus]